METHKAMLAFCRFYLAFAPQADWRVIKAEDADPTDGYARLRADLTSAALVLESALAVFPSADVHFSHSEGVAIYHGWQACIEQLGSSEMLQNLSLHWPAPSSAEVEGNVAIAMQRLLYALPAEKSKGQYP